MNDVIEHNNIQTHEVECYRCASKMKIYTYKDIVCAPRNSIQDFTDEPQTQLLLRVIEEKDKEIKELLEKLTEKCGYCHKTKTVCFSNHIHECKRK